MARRQRRPARGAQPQIGGRRAQPIRGQLQQRPERRGHPGHRAHPLLDEHLGQRLGASRSVSTTVAPAQQTCRNPAATP